ncbi:MAG TPA: ZIP family metal transporter [Candidatus Limnocylindrales bacterium]|jgi:ZIP family zinc transporter
MPPAALLPFFSTLAGGFAALRLRHRIHAFMALAAGVVVATAVADLLPEALALVGPAHQVRVGVAAVAGFIGFSLVEAFLHQTSFEHGDDESIDAGAGHDRPPDVLQGGRGALAILPPLSLILHSTLDGVAIGLAFQAGSDIGVIVLLAVLAHDFADGMNVVTLALEAARGARLAVVMLVLDALAPPFGAALSYLITLPPSGLGLLLAGVAGVFLAVGAGHLLPEAQHDDPRRGPSLVLLAGFGGAFVLVIRSLAP